MRDFFKNLLRFNVSGGSKVVLFLLISIFAVAFLTALLVGTADFSFSVGNYLIWIIVLAVVMPVIFLVINFMPWCSGVFNWKNRMPSKKVVITTVIALVVLFLWSPWSERDPATEAALAPAQATTYPIELLMEEWESWPDIEAPVGTFAYSEVPRGKKFDFDPMGKVLIRVEGSEKAIMYSPGDPEPHLGTIWNKVGYMSLEDKPVKVVRKVQK